MNAPLTGCDLISSFFVRGGNDDNEGNDIEGKDIKEVFTRFIRACDAVQKVLKEQLAGVPEAQRLLREQLAASRHVLADNL